MVQAVLSLGSNVGDAPHNLRTAINLLAACAGVAVVSVSSFYSTSPLYVLEQDDFVNCCVLCEVDSRFDVRAFLTVTQGIERAMKRVKLVDKGPRVIDVDIVFFGDEVVDTVDLCVPHPAYLERLFVLVPLLEILPDAVDPRTGRRIALLQEEKEVAGCYSGQEIAVVGKGE